MIFYLGLALFILHLLFKLLYIFFPLCSRTPKLENKVTSYKSFAVLVPAYNEERVIANCLGSLQNLPYPNYRVYIIDDGSSDHTLGVLKNKLSLVPVQLKENLRLKYKPVLAKYRSKIHPNIFVISKVNGGKADALNAGISCCKEDIVITLDADCMLKDDALAIMNQAFANEKIVAAGGTVHITQNINVCGKEKLIFKLKNLIRYQVVQYLNGFYLYKLTQSRLKSLLVISGAFGAFKRDMLLELKGYRQSVGEDMDITLKVHKYIRKKHNQPVMTYVPQSVCYTECPEGLKNLTRQRIRWQKAFIDCAAKYGHKMFRQFNFGISLFFIIDYLILGTLMAFIFLLTPLYILIDGRLSLMLAIMVSADVIVGMAECLVSKKIASRYQFAFSRPDSLRYCLFVFIELFSFRFLNIFFAVYGTLCYFINKNRWHKADRLGRRFAVPENNYIDSTDEALPGIRVPSVNSN